MEAIKKIFKPIHFASFSQLKGVNWANAAAILLAVVYLLAIVYSEEIQEFVDIASN